MLVPNYSSFPQYRWTNIPLIPADTNCKICLARHKIAINSSPIIMDFPHQPFMGYLPCDFIAAATQQRAHFKLRSFCYIINLELSLLEGVIIIMIKIL